MKTTEPYSDLYRRLLESIPKDRLIRDDLRRLAYGTDASFYRLIPRIVVKVESEQEVIAILHAANALLLPVTFRAAGTSLSGQAISDSVLVLLGPSWNGHEVLEDGRRIRLQPGVVGGHANRFLRAFGKKIGPDPASIDSAMIGGIAANNASGMCCGTAQNSYRTLHSMRIIFADGSVLDTGDRSSREAFATSHPEVVEGVGGLAARVRASARLADRIRTKYKM